MDVSVQEALLKDPRVQQSIKAAPYDALGDAEVQRQILEACKREFPQHANHAAAQIKAWAKDPVVQEKAKDYAGLALGYAKGAGHHIMKRIEQGPTGVRALAFVGGVASCVNALLSLLNILSVLGHPVLYVVSFYLFFFSLTTMLFESKPEWIQSAQEKCPALQVDTYQDMLLENAKFLSLTGGRGLFYIFQGTMWLTVSSLTNFVNLLIGLYLIFIGVLHVLMHRGVMPQEVAAKMREGYEAIGTKDEGFAGPEHGGQRGSRGEEPPKDVEHGGQPGHREEPASAHQGGRRSHGDEAPDRRSHRDEPPDRRGHRDEPPDRHHGSRQGQGGQHGR